MSTNWQSSERDDRRGAYRATARLGLEAVLTAGRRSLRVRLRELSETGCVAAWPGAKEDALGAGTECELLVQFPESADPLPVVRATVRHGGVRDGVCTAGLELHIRPKIAHAAFARELRRAWMEAQRRALRERRDGKTP